METKKIIIDGKEIEIDLKLDDEFYEKNYDNEELENTLELKLDKINEVNNNE